MSADEAIGGGAAIAARIEAFVREAVAPNKADPRRGLRLPVCPGEAP